MTFNNHGEAETLDTSLDSEVAQVIRQNLKQTRYLPGWNDSMRHWSACGFALQFFYASGILALDNEGVAEQAAIRDLVDLLLQEERELEQAQAALGMPQTVENEHYLRVVGPIQLIYMAALMALPDLEKAAQSDSTSVEGEYLVTVRDTARIMTHLFEQYYPQYRLASWQLPDFQTALLLVPCPYCRGSHPPRLERFCPANPNRPAP